MSLSASRSHRRAPTVARSLFLLMTGLLAVASCTPGEAESVEQEPEAELPELAAVGGAQDLWAFPFSLSATRGQVEDAYGEPTATRTDRDRGGPGARIIEWDYPGVTLAFFARTDGSDEYLVSARISDASVPVNGPLGVGMSADELRSQLGEPQVDTGAQLVYFFSLTTIEVTYRDNTVTTITLGRALP